MVEEGEVSVDNNVFSDRTQMSPELCQQLGLSEVTNNAISKYFHPITTSNTIIIAKPIAKPIVATLECSPWEASGMSSSTTT